MNKSIAIRRINELATANTPFLFVTDFKNKQNHVWTIDDLQCENILFEINGTRNFKPKKHNKEDVSLVAYPTAYSDYLATYQQVHQQIVFGNTYLLNLTFPTPIETKASLSAIFYQSTAKYKLLFKNQFVVFSPEIFIKIQKGRLSSFPMKGTIDADLPDAKEKLLCSAKEMAEHTTIVDLIRSDMSKVANEVQVATFRYIEKVKTNRKHLLQASSKIIGKLPIDYLHHLGDIIYSLLPAGSISGAPKRKTIEIIAQAENYERGYYTGVMGYFDGANFDSGVMIRYIENNAGQMIYKSGGGIHFLSNPTAEYQELIDKIYVPVR